MKIYLLTIFLFLISWQSTADDLIGGSAVMERQRDQEQKAFALIDPEQKAMLENGPVVFRWKKPDISDSHIKKYEVAFWSNRKGFGKKFTVVPDDLGKETSYLEFNDFRNVFKRHGNYYWRVTAYDSVGGRRTSEIRNFMVGIPSIREGFVPWTFPYAVQFQYTHRPQTNDFKAFLTTVDPVKSLKSFADIGFIFHQNNFFGSPIDVQEKLFILSQFGFGAEISSRFRILRNTYFSLYPQMSFASYWYSTGIKNYSSTLRTFQIGMNFMFMPKGYLTLRASWIPSYKLRYSTKLGELRTFLGSGWEYGFRLIIPRNIIDNFQIFGLDIDFRRIPLEFHVSHIRDKYTKTKMNMQRFSISYLLF